MIPQNEMGVIVLFSQRAIEDGITILEIGAAFPDARIKKGDKEYLVEFEYASSNFFNHHHDIRKCDLIVCWNNNYTLFPLPVIELQNDNWVNEEIITISDQRKELAYWMHRAKSAEAKLSAIANENVVVDGTEVNNRWTNTGGLQGAIFSLLDRDNQLGPRAVSRRVGCSVSTAKTHVDRWKTSKR